MRIEPVFPNYGRFLCDESRLTGCAEEIAFPESTKDLIETFQYAEEKRLRITLQGARTGLSGGAVPKGGLIVSLSGMSGLSDCEKHGESALIRAQAGTTLEQIEKKAASCGYTFPPDPSEQTATIGGMFANGASGMSGLCSGATSVSVLELDWVTPSREIWRIRRGAHTFNDNGCVLPDGQLLATEWTGARKGTDLIDFLSGSEGRLGIAAGFGLMLQRERKERWGVLFFFRGNVETETFICGLAAWRNDPEHADLLFAAEFFNRPALEVIEAGSAHRIQSPLPEFPENARAAVYIELRGDDEASLEEALETLSDLFTCSGGADKDTWSESGRSVDKLRTMRHTLVEAFYGHTFDPESGNLRLDACFHAPGERSAECLHAYLRASEESGILFIVYGHVLEQRMHVAFSPKDATERRASIGLLRDLAGKIRLFGGTPAFDYGIGRLERPWLDPTILKQRNAQTHALSRFFDPQGLLGG
jgi:D-lactate dehydrogenase (cytochrome)